MTFRSSGSCSALCSIQIWNDEIYIKGEANNFRSYTIHYTVLLEPEYEFGFEKFTASLSIFFSTTKEIASKKNLHYTFKNFDNNFSISINNNNLSTVPSLLAIIFMIP